MSWQLLITISVLGTSAITLLQRAMLRDQEYDPIAYSVVFLALGATFVAAYAALTTHQPIISSATPYLNILISSLLYGVGVLLTFQALQKVTASKFAILFSTRAIWSTLLATIFFS